MNNSSNSTLSYWTALSRQGSTTHARHYRRAHTAMLCTCLALRSPNAQVPCTPSARVLCMPSARVSCMPSVWVSCMPSAWVSCTPSARVSCKPSARVPHAQARPCVQHCDIAFSIATESSCRSHARFVARVRTPLPRAQLHHDLGSLSRQGAQSLCRDKEAEMGSGPLFLFFSALAIFFTYFFQSYCLYKIYTNSKRSGKC